MIGQPQRLKRSKGLSPSYSLRARYQAARTDMEAWRESFCRAPKVVCKLTLVTRTGSIKDNTPGCVTGLGKAGIGAGAISEKSETGMRTASSSGAEGRGLDWNTRVKMSTSGGTTAKGQ